MKLESLSGPAVIIGVLGAMLVAGCPEETREQPFAYDPNLKPFEIHVCMDVPEGAEFPEDLIWKGIRNAHKRKGVLAGRKIELIRKDPDAGTFDSLEAIEEFARKEDIDGPVLFPSSRIFGSNGDFSRDSGVFITIVPSTQRLRDKGQECAVQIGSSLKERARAAALFARNSLKAADAMIILDQDTPDSIVLASMFSSELIRLGGAVSEVRILSGENADLQDTLKAVKEKNPGVIYMPYSEKTALPVIELLQKQGQKSPVIVVNVQQEQAFLAHGGENLEGVYLVTDSHSQNTRSERIGDLIKRVFRIPESREYAEPLAALGADAYYLLLELLQDMEEDGARREAGQPPYEREGFLAGRSDSRYSSRLHRNLYVCRVENGLLQGPHLVHVESVDPSRLRSWH